MPVDHDDPFRTNSPPEAEENCVNKEFALQGVLREVHNLEGFEIEQVLRAAATLHGIHLVNAKWGLRMKTSTQRLAAILFEEFERDGWGDIDPTLFGLVADGWDETDMSRDEDDVDEDAEADAKGLVKVLERVVKRINMCPNCTEHAPCKEHTDVCGKCEEYMPCRCVG